MEEEFEGMGCGNSSKLACNIENMTLQRSVTLRFFQKLCACKQESQFGII